MGIHMKAKFAVKSSTVKEYTLIKMEIVIKEAGRTINKVDTELIHFPMVLNTRASFLGANQKDKVLLRIDQLKTMIFLSLGERGSRDNQMEEEQQFIKMEINTTVSFPKVRDVGKDHIGLTKF
jgi:hypothetical protein